MPIRDENKARYPRNWPTISQQVRERAGQKCEKCGAPNGVYIARGGGKDAGTYMLADGGETFNAETGEFLGLSRGSEYEGVSIVKVILTVAHLDHQPENCAPDNLRAWCQRCHNIYDAPMRRAGTKARRRSANAVGDMFP